MIAPINGENILVRKFAHTLRLKCFTTIFGLTEDEVIDPLLPKFIESVDKHSRKNQEVYRQIFGCYPDDKMTKEEEIHHYREMADISLYEQLKHKIVGLAVKYPYKFLSSEDLRVPKYFDISTTVLPTSTFT
jgi:hypothetical protein